MKFSFFFDSGVDAKFAKTLYVIFQNVVFSKKSKDRHNSETAERVSKNMVPMDSLGSRFRSVCHTSNSFRTIISLCF